VRPRRKHHIGPSSLFYLLVTSLLGVGAIQSQNNLLLLVFGVALSSIVVSGVLSGVTLSRIRVSRSIAGPAQVGLPLRIVYTVTNKGRALPAFALTLEERAPGRREAERWTDALPRSRGFIPMVRPRSSASTSVSVTPVRRGPVSLPGPRASSSFPFGIIRKSVTERQPARVLVRPRVHALRRDALADTLGEAAWGTGRPRRRGLGDEFVGLRDYTPGDSPRRIDWRASARSESLVVRQHAHAPAPRLRIVLHLEPEAGDAAESERLIELAASLLGLAADLELDVGFELPQAGVTIRDQTPRPTLARALDALAELDVSALRGANVPHTEATDQTRSGAAVIAVTASERIASAHADAVLTGADLDRLRIGEEQDSSTKRSRPVRLAS
jgi:uncharacterized protein (DUF58 family)